MYITLRKNFVVLGLTVNEYTALECMHLNFMILIPALIQSNYNEDKCNYRSTDWEEKSHDNNRELGLKMVQLS